MRQLWALSTIYQLYATVMSPMWQLLVNIQCLTIELYKVFKDICPDIMKDVFLWSIYDSNYDIKSKRTFTTRSVKTVYYGTESLSYLSPKVWEFIPNNIKSLENLLIFKKAIKIGNLMYALVDSTSRKSALCSGCNCNFHFYIYLFICIFFPILFNFVIRIVDLD